LIRGGDDDEKELLDTPAAKKIDGITSYQQINEWMARSDE